MIKKTVLFLSLFISTLYAQSINIAVAANVSYASDELIKEFKLPKSLIVRSESDS